MIITMFLTATGFIIIFVAVRGYSQVSLHSNRWFIRSLLYLQ